MTPLASFQTTDIQQHTPAETGIWLFILADLTLFALFFFVFANDKSNLPEQFIAGQATLNTYFGAFNTVVLLFSSYFVATAVHAARILDKVTFTRSIKLTMLCGFAFLVVKFLEYREKLELGFHIASNEFYRNYFVFTGIHLWHVIIGLSLLGFILFESRKPNYLNDKQAFVEGSALYWHMVDLLWVVLFSLIYLVP